MYWIVCRLIKIKYISKLNRSLDRSNYQILWSFSADNLCAYYNPGYTISISFSCLFLHFWCDLMLWLLILSTITQLKLVLMQPPLFRGHSELTITNLAGTGRWNYLDLDKLKHRKLSLVCLGFTSMNVPPMLRCPGPSAFRHNQMSGVAFGGHVLPPWPKCSSWHLGRSPL
jgi:hypothetical protein